MTARPRIATRTTRDVRAPRRAHTAPGSAPPPETAAEPDMTPPCPARDTELGTHPPALHPGGPGPSGRRPRAAPGRATPTRRRPVRVGAIAARVLVTAAVALSVAPLLLALSVALRSPADLAERGPLAPPLSPTLQGFAGVLADPSFSRALLVSALTTVLVAAVQLPLSAHAAWAFTVLRFRGRRALVSVVVATLFLPPIAIAVPLGALATRAGLRDTLPGLVLPTLLGSAFAIFLLRQQFRTLPRELVDAARVDGLGTLGTLWRIAVPARATAIAVVALITIAAQWNAYLWPLMISGRSWQTVALAVSSIPTRYDESWTLVMAASLLVLAPVVVLVSVFGRALARPLDTGVDDLVEEDA